MGWKKPKWLQKVQTAAQKAVNTVAAPVAAAPAKILPGLGAILDAGKNIVHGVGDVIASPIDGNFTKGIKKIGSGIVDAGYHAGRGLVVDPLIQTVGGVGSKGSVEETTKGDKIGGQSGGAAVRPLPPLSPETEDDTIPPGAYKEGKPVGPNRDRQLPAGPMRDTSPKNTVMTAPQYGFTSERTPEIRSSMLQRMKQRYKR
jgi:hypothetical protein